MSGTHITIPETSPEVAYVASASQTEFDIPFAFFNTTDIVVVQNGTVVPPADYTVTGTAVDAGYTDGTVTLDTGATVGDEILIYRAIPIERLSDFPYPSQILEVRTLNTEIDKLYAIVQDKDRQFGRALRVPETESPIAPLPAAEDRADGLLGFDANGAPTIVTLGDLGGVQGPQGEQGPPGQGAPIGAILPWAGATAPTGFLFCYGQAISRTTYADLFGVIGTNYGAGNGTTTFNVPDLRGRFPLAKDNMGGSAANRVTAAASGITATTLGATGGSQLLQQHNHPVTDAGHDHTASTGAEAAHTHAYIGKGTYNGVNGDYAAGTDGSNENKTSGVGSSHSHTVTVNSNTTGIAVGNSGSGDSQNIPPAIVLNFVICYAYVDGTSGGGGGTVTSVDVSGGTTGLTFSGGPVVTSGTITAAGTLAVANGGTGATSAANARANLDAARTNLVGSPVAACIPVGDETTAITTGTAKVTFRMPFAMTLTAVRASLTTASSSGTPTIDINEAGSTILSTKLTIDANEKTSTTAATAAVISDTALADDAEMTIDIDTAGTGAAGLKVYLIGTRA